MIEQDSAEPECNGGSRIYESRLEQQKQQQQEIQRDNDDQTDSSLRIASTGESSSIRQEANDFRNLTKILNRRILNNLEGRILETTTSDDNSISRELEVSDSGQDIDELLSVYSADVADELEASILSSDHNQLLADDILSVAGDSEHETKVLLLDYYISKSIAAGDEQCGCHYEHEETRQDFRDKLSDCYRRKLRQIEQSKQQQSTPPVAVASHQRGSLHNKTLERRFNNFNDADPFRNNRLLLQQQQEPIAGGRHLFIDDKVNATAAKTKTKTPSPRRKCHESRGQKLERRSSRQRQQVDEEEEENSLGLQASGATSGGCFARVCSECRAATDKNHERISSCRPEQRTFRESSGASICSNKSQQVGQSKPQIDYQQQQHQQRGASPLELQYPKSSSGSSAGFSVGRQRQQVRVRKNKATSVTSKQSSLAALDYQQVKLVSSLIQRVEPSSTESSDEANGELDDYEEDENEDEDLVRGSALASFAESPFEPLAGGQSQLGPTSNCLLEQTAGTSSSFGAPSFEVESQVGCRDLNYNSQERHLDCNLTDNNSAISLSWSYESLLELTGANLIANLNSNLEETEEVEEGSNLNLGKKSLSSQDSLSRQEDINLFIENCIARHQASAGRGDYIEENYIQNHIENYEQEAEEEEQNLEQLEIESLASEECEDDDDDELLLRKSGDNTTECFIEELEEDSLAHETSERQAEARELLFSCSNLDNDEILNGRLLRLAQQSDNSSSINSNSNSALGDSSLATSYPEYRIHCNCRRKSDLFTLSTTSKSLALSSVEGPQSARLEEATEHSSLCCDECSHDKSSGDWPSETHNGDNPNGRFQVQVEERGEPLVAPSATSCDHDEPNYPINPSSSMRAVKDIAKCSVPSLAALQYLPGQTDSSGSQRGKRKRSQQKSAAANNSAQAAKVARLATQTLSSPLATRQQRQLQISSGSSFSPVGGGSHSFRMSGNMAPQSDKRHQFDEVPIETGEQQRQQQQQRQRGGKLSESNQKTQPSETQSDHIKHDESCLLHRLCLCNCMAKESAPVEFDSAAAANQRKGAKSPSKIKSISAAGKRSPSGEVAPTTVSSKSSSSSPTRADVKTRSSKSKRIEKEEQQKRGELKAFEATTSDKYDHPKGTQTQKQQQQHRLAEKQSPKFMSLLGMTNAEAEQQQQQQRAKQTTHLTPDHSNVKSAGKTATNTKTASSRRWEMRPNPQTKLALGSVGELVACASGSSSRDLADLAHAANESGSSRAQSRCNSASTSSSYSASSLPHLRARSTSFATNNSSSLASGDAHKLHSLASENIDEIHEHPDQQQRPQSSASQRKIPSYRKFLSPSRLFSASSKSQTDISGQREDNPQTQQQQQQEKSSFLSRSLNRLSGRVGRKKRANRQQEGGKKSPDRLDRTKVSSIDGIVSPEISISNASIDSNQSNDLDSELNCSFDHYINLYSRATPDPAKQPTAKTSARLTPGIVVNQVAYMGGCNCGDQDGRPSGSMCSCQGENRGSNYASRPTAAVSSDHLQRQQRETGSDLGHSYNVLSGNNQLDSLESQHSTSLRACSLPASPRTGRKLYNDPSHQQQRRGARSPRLSSSPVPFHSPASQSTKIEDGLRVCSIEHFEKHIGNIKGNQIEAQKKLFKAWINHFSPNLIRHDLIEELRDGIKLIGLLAALTNDKELLCQYEKLNRDKQSYVNRLIITPSSRLKHLSNVSIAIDYLRQNAGMRLINLNPMDIVSGKPNVILGLCWNLILNFQLEQNLLKFRHHKQTDNYFLPNQVTESSSKTQTNTRSSSRLSEANKLEDTAAVSESRKQQVIQKQPQRRNDPKFKDKTSIGGLGSHQSEEYTQRDLVNAKNRLLDHINQRFNLKLTHLTSNLVDGDVLMVILKQLIPRQALEAIETIGDSDDATNRQIEESDKLLLTVNSEGKCWKLMDDDERLDHCFHLASKHLNVPILFSASDLKQQSIAENNSKPILVYLSMLLECEQSDAQRESANKQEVDLDSLSKLSHSSEEERREQANGILRQLLADASLPNRFEVDRMQVTLRKLQEACELIGDDIGANGLDSKLVAKYRKLKREAEQVDSLIQWINEADKLFEEPQKSPADLAHAIQTYERFFDQTNGPNVSSIAVSSTLERQYRECQATARQRIHFMEQTLKNWESYEQARQKLRDWLATAEAKLSNALRPNHLLDDGGPSSVQSIEPIDLHSNCLEDLIEYFELSETYESNLDPEQPIGGMNRPPTAQEKAPTTSSNLLHPYHGQMSTSLGSIDDAISISGSQLSLGSNSSRLSSILTNSKRASYYRLFDDFELKCRLLAAMLEADQRDALLLGVRELKYRLKYITDQRVPNVLNELRMSISRCEMSIKEQDESCETTEQIISQNSHDEDDDLTSGDISECVSSDPADNMLSSVSDKPVEDDVITPEVDPAQDLQKTVAKEVARNLQSLTPTEELTVQPEAKKSETQTTRNKIKAKRATPEPRRSSPKKAKGNKEQPKTVATNETAWSLFNWFSPNKKAIRISGKSGTKETKDQTQARGNKSAKVTGGRQKKGGKSETQADKSKKPLGAEASDEYSSSIMAFWRKIIRASRASLSLNIVLLVCLAGICVVPLINRESCCELDQAPIDTTRIGLTQKPT